MPDPEPNGPKHYRFFIAVLIPVQIKSEMAAVQAELQTKLPKGSVTWTKPEQLHVTLRFLGKVAVDQVSTLKAQVASALKCSAPFELCAERVGAFPDTRFPRVLWVGLNDTEGKLTQIHTLVEGAVRQFSPQEGHERFYAHATLGRVKHLGARDKKSLCDLLSRLSQRSFGKWCVNEVELMRSELSSQGALHTCVASFPLTAFSQASFS
jgi:RNA 2',3'-cyclic 3'-phosphodiesterase